MSPSDAAGLRAASPPGRKWGLIAILVAITGGLFALDFTLERTERAELSGEARGHFEDGKKLLRSGSQAAALESLRRAHSLDRTNREYEAELVLALIANGLKDEAEAMVNDLLAHDSNNGEANLLAARLMAQTGRFSSAEAYYHRAIYGSWTGDQRAQRVKARLELIHELAARGADSELLAELLPLQTEAQSDRNVQKQVANLLIVAGAPLRAADAYRQLIARDPKDASPYEGLGRAALAVGDYRAAQAAFLSAFRLQPNDATIRKDMEISSSLAALDPTPRRLRSAEKYRRSVRILELATEESAACPVLAAAAAGSGAQAQTAPVAGPPRAPASTYVANEDAEQKLAQAELLWQGVRKACPAEKTSRTEELRLIMRKISQ